MELNDGEYYEVRYIAPEFCFCDKDGNYGGNAEAWQDFAVAGNIYENPDLLTEQQ